MAKYVEKKIGNHVMKLRAKEGGLHGTLRRLKAGGEREPELLHILRREIEEGMVCMDLGANIGYVTLLMAERVGPRGRVYAIEPDPANVEVLKMNVVLNGYTGRVDVFQMAISNRNKKMNFYVGRSSNLGGMAETGNTRKGAKPVKVKAVTLTEFCRKRDVPQLIKMDIEGHEVEVLEGMYDLVKGRKFPCKIVMELHPIHYSAEHSLEYWMKCFLGCGFRTKYVISAAVVQPDLFKEWGYEPIKSFKSNRALYDRFSEPHMLIACCRVNRQLMPNKKKYSPKIARFVMLERK